MKIHLNPVNAFRLFVIVCLVFSAVVLPANPPRAVYAQPLLADDTPTPTQEEVAPTPEVTENPTELPTETPTPEITEEPTETATPEVTENPTETATPEITEEVTETPEPPTAEPTEEDAESQATAICASAAFPIECEALVKLYTSTNGSGWTRRTGWMTANPICPSDTNPGWHGITCSGSGNVTKIILSSNRLTGPIPAEIGNLSSLQELNFQNNALTGTLPSELTKLKNVLQSIDLNTNNYAGEIPAWFGEMTALKSLLLSFNQFSGSIPTSFGNMKNLERLEMARNKLTGSIPVEFGGMESLLFVWAYENQITGSIPASVNNLTEMRWFHFANNQLSGTIPSLSNVNLQVLNLANNDLTGNLPSINHMNDLQQLDLSNNALTGSISADFSQIPLLESINLSGNQLTGSVPTSLGSAASLQILNLGKNNLTGGIPSQLQNLVNLKALYLDNNQLEGTWPIWLQNLTKLELLNLSNNLALGDLLPPEIGNLTNLRLLDISHNHFWGEIPTTITKLTKLNTANSVGVRSYTDIGHNHLSSKNTTVRAFLSKKDPDWEKTQTPVNAPPVIQSLNPPYVIIGHSTNVTLQVRGKNMMDGAVVYLDGVERPTTFVNKWILEIEVPSSMFASESTMEVTALNPWPTSGISAGYNFYVSDILPAVGSTVLTRRPYFLWYYVEGASYQFQISTSSVFSTGVTTLTSPTNSLEYTKDLPLNKMMYWRVRTLIGDQIPDWSESETYSFRSARPPSNPVLASPANNSLTTNYKPKLTWRAVSLPSGTSFEKYQIQVANDPSFDIGTVVVDEDVMKLSTPTYTLKDGDLQPNTKYYWRVRSFNTLAHYSSWSAVRAIRSAMLPPVLTTPALNVTAATPRPTMEWQRVVGATGYTIQFSLYSNFSSLLFSATVKPADLMANPVRYTSTRSLPQKRTIYWRVRAAGPNGPSLWSLKTDGKFFSANPPSTPSLSAPSNNGLVTNYTPQLKWSASSLPTGTTFMRYELEVSLYNTFPPEPDTRLYTIANRSTPYQVLDTLNPNSRYYWRVRAFSIVNSAEHSSIWSTVRSFRTAMRPVTGLTVTNQETLRPLFSWTPPLLHPSVPPTSVKNYTIQLSLSSTFGTIITSGTTAGTTYTPTVDLPKYRTIHWRVRANGDFGPTLWVSGSFLSANPPSTPALVSPANGALLKFTPAYLDWSNSTIPAGTVFARYEVEIATDTSFTTNYQLIPAGIGDKTQSFLAWPTLSSKTKYYWRVRSVNTVEQVSPWSARRSFTTP